MPNILEIRRAASERISTTRLQLIFDSQLGIHKNNFRPKFPLPFLDAKGIISPQDLRDGELHTWLLENRLPLGRLILPENLSWDKVLNISVQAGKNLSKIRNKLWYMQLEGKYTKLSEREASQVLELSCLPVIREISEGVYMPMNPYSGFANLRLLTEDYFSQDPPADSIHGLRGLMKFYMWDKLRSFNYQSGEEYSL